MEKDASRTFGAGRALLIAGPTASGKSGLALTLARALNGAIINADSMQIYSGARILTARPADREKMQAPHMLYGVVDPAEACSAGRYGVLAAGALLAARAAGLVPIFTGGTGLYFRVLTEGLTQIPAVPGEIRRRVRAHVADVGAAAAHASLSRRDPETAAGLRPGDRQRIARALEVLEATGMGLAQWQERWATPVLAPGSWAGLVLDPPRPALYARCDARFRAMMAAGALAEARALAGRGLDPGLPLMKAVGVRQLLAHLSGAMDLEAAVAAAQTETRRFAKRQLTWARGRMRPDAGWTWLCNGEAEAPEQPALAWAGAALATPSGSGRLT